MPDENIFWKHGKSQENSYIYTTTNYLTTKYLDEIYNLNANLPDSEAPKKIFQGCKKSCHIFHKFDSNSERKFAKILEQDNEILKWLRPAANQFDIFYKNFSRYEPDFVVETAAKIYCETATNFNKENGGKTWKYILLPHDEIHLNSSFEYLVANR